MAKHTERIADFLRTNGYGILAALLLLNALTLTLSPDDTLRQLVDRFMLATVAIVGLLASATTTKRWTIGGTLAGLTSIQLLVFPAGPEAHGGILPALYFFAYLMPCLVIDVFSKRRTIAERLLAAACLYVVMAIAFAQVYATINAAPPEVPPSFAELGTPTILDADAVMYFSFVTQTTLGYGDIVPIAPAARAVVIIQSTLGVLYLAIVVAALVSQRSEPTTNRD